MAQKAKSLIYFDLETGSAGEMYSTAAQRLYEKQESGSRHLYIHSVAVAAQSHVSSPIELKLHQTCTQQRSQRGTWYSLFYRKSLLFPPIATIYARHQYAA